jgi:hypothetical protein
MTLLKEIEEGAAEGLKKMCDVALALAKAEDSTVMEVQAMYYRVDKSGKFQLAISANNARCVPEIVDLIQQGLTNSAHYNARAAKAQAEALHQLEVVPDFAVVFRDVIKVKGNSHAEQNLLKSIVTKLKSHCRIYIYGTKPPCNQCRLVLDGYKARLGSDDRLLYSTAKGDINVRAFDGQLDPSTLALPK